MTVELLENISKAIESGKIRQARSLVTQALEAGYGPGEILNVGLLNGLKAVGRRFTRDGTMVSEVLISTRAINECLELIRPMLLTEKGEPIGRVCIGSVRGDLHDVGKNIVRLMLESRNFEIVDLGVDVPPEAFVRAVTEDHCDIVCCSALLTATMPEMEQVVEALKSAGIRDRVIVMVGGMPVTEEYCRRIGADIYTADGALAAEKAEEALREKRKREALQTEAKEEKTMTDLKAMAKACGFTVAEDLDPKTLKFMPEVRDMCTSCRNYDKSWACPPACGTLEEWQGKASRFTKGILMQCVGELEDSFDIEGLQALGERNREAMGALMERVQELHLDCLPMGTGGCGLCKQCTYPDEPCRFPEKRRSSMEACGLLVNQVCTDNGVPYNYGPGKMAYTSCLLYNE